MKKLLVLSVLLGLMALPMFASDITFGGDATFGFIGDFGDAEADDTNATFDVMVTIDDYSSLTINTEDLETTAWSGINKILVTTDVGAWLGLPAGVVVSWGYDDPNSNNFHVTSGYENEDFFDFGPTDYWGLDFLISYNIIEVELAFNPGVAATNDGYILAGLALIEPIPGLSAEVYYFQGGPGVATDVYDMGNIAFDAGYSTEVAGIALDVGAGFMLDLDDAAADAWAWGLGLAAAVSMFDITVGVDGDETDVLSGLTATVDVAAHEKATIYVGLQMDLYDAAAETFNHADLGVNAHVGAVEVYVGYLVTSVGDNSYNAPTELVDGGAYIKFDVDY